MGAVAPLAAAIVVALGGATAWEERSPLPVPRTEVAAAPFRGDIAVVGGYLPDRSSSDDVDLYDPASDSWSRLPDLPVDVNHASAVSAGGKLYVVGGYGGPGVRLRNAYVFDGDSWRGLKPLPAARAAAGAAAVGGKLYVVGGVGPNGLARRAYALDLQSGRWTSIAGPTPREHLAATAAGGKVYAVAGRLAGLDTNLRVFEAYSPRTRRWTRLTPVPKSRGGTGVSFAKGLVVSVGGEAPQGTIGSVYGYDIAKKRWRRLANLPTPRHGVGVATIAGRVYVIGGGTEPGLTVSGANEALTIP
jgi:N-acetylneuraminic acid mutarotase